MNFKVIIIKSTNHGHLSYIDLDFFN